MFLMKARFIAGPRLIIKLPPTKKPDRYSGSGFSSSYVNRFSERHEGNSSRGLR